MKKNSLIDKNRVFRVTGVNNVIRMRQILGLI